MKKAAGIIFRSLLLVLLGLVIGMYIGSNSYGNQGLNIALRNNDKISRALRLVRSSYVDSVNTDSLEGVTVNNMLQTLDPHSVYLKPQKAEKINESLEGGFTGIGIEYLLLRDTVVVTHIYPGGPAADAGLMPGDKILRVDNRKFSGTGLNPDKIDKVFRGREDTKISLSITAPGDDSVRAVTISRGHVDFSSVDAAYMAAPGTGYIKISRFALTTDSDFRTALARLQNQGMKKLILDLRGNGGGYLSAATAMADEFLKKNQLIVYTKGAHEERKDYFATDSGKFQDGKMAVLIDEYSASASEILTGALQDLDRAVIIGRRSFGKGLVQQQFPFDDGSAINLTVARYYTPSGRSIQKSYRDGVASYHDDIAERMRRGELFSAQSNLNDSAFKTATVYHTVTGRKVYSGGGIMPDIFVPEDTTENTMLIAELNNDKVFTAYTVDTLQQVLKHFGTLGDFIRGYAVTDSTFDNFITYASQTIREMDPQDIKVSKPVIKTLLKAYAARFKWGDNAYFEVANGNDACLKKAITVLN